MSERDTHFANFAKRLLNEMLEVRTDYIEFNKYDTDEAKRYEQIIAQYAYDLVEHVLQALTPQHPTGVSQHLTEDHISYLKVNYGIPSVSDIIKAIPDMTELPEHTEE